jgi:NAD(P)-dependent dehydrogenase (short-subunit alcohol dehydrogenase family)
MPSYPLRFSDTDIATFSAASGDKNLLHCSESYAAKTAYGEPVVFGALGALACLSVIEIPSGMGIAGVDIDFSRPMFRDVSYEIVIAEANTERISLRIRDGTTSLLHFTAKLRRSGSLPLPHRESTSISDPALARTEARCWDESELVPGSEVQGQNNPDWTAAELLQKRWSVSAAKRSVFIALLASSYLVGMELPGESALFSRMSVELSNVDADPASPIGFKAQVVSFDQRLNKVHLHVRLALGAFEFARGSAWSFVRSSLPPLDAAILHSWLRPSTLLTGRVALVIGASRGLGAATAAMLASQGCDVVANYHRGASETDRLSCNVDSHSGRIFPACADASDLGACRVLKEEVVADRGRLDFLVCNASPAVLALRLEENSYARVEAHIHRALALVLTPLSVFLPLLEQSEGTLAVISSIYSDEPVKEFPHYTAAKRAIEGLAQVAALQYPKIRVIILKPTKILTGLTNTPMGRRNAVLPERVAACLVSRLCQTSEPGVEIISGASLDEIVQ